jgi:single-strand DNA-binding protein
MLNSFLGIGRVGSDAEVTTTRNGDAMARFSIAIDRVGRKGQESDPDWIRCHIFGDRARMLAPYVTKGTLVGISGRLESYKTSAEPPRTMLKVVVAELNFLGRPSSREEEPAAQQEEPAELALVAV